MWGIKFKKGKKMEISRLTISKETQEQLSKPLTKRERGRLRYIRLKELGEKGILSKARTREDVLKMVGFTDATMKTGDAWLGYMIKQGYLKETVVWKRGRKGEYEYTMGSKEPNYDLFNRNASKKKKVEPVVEQVEAVVEPVKKTKAIFRHNGVEIELEEANQELILALVDKMLGA